MNETIRKIAGMLEDGWVQLSRKFRMVGNLPQGKTGIEMIREVDPARAAQEQLKFDRQMKDTYLRTYATRQQGSPCIQELTESEFNEFLKQKNALRDEEWHATLRKSQENE